VPPWTRIASCLRRASSRSCVAHSPEQTFQKQACVPRKPVLPEQWTYPLLKLLKRRSPQRQASLQSTLPASDLRIMVCPWIQKSSERATVMLSGQSVFGLFTTWLPQRNPAHLCARLRNHNSPAIVVKIARTIPGAALSLLQRLRSQISPCMILLADCGTRLNTVQKYW